MTILTIAVVFIAVLLGIVHWKIVREVLLWTAAALTILGFLAAVVLFILAVIYLDITLALVGAALLILAGLLSAIEAFDRNAKFAKWRSYVIEQYKRNNNIQ